MTSGKVRLFIFTIIAVFVFSGVSAQQQSDQGEQTLNRSIELLKRYFYEKGAWKSSAPEIEKDVKGIVNFIEDQPIDTIIDNIDKRTGQESFRYVYRLPENVDDSLKVPGYYPSYYLQADLEVLAIRLQDQYQNKQVEVPKHYTQNLDEKLDLVPEGEGMQLFTDSTYIIPDTLQIPEIIPDSLLNSPENFEKLRRTDSLRSVYIETMRVKYNDSLVMSYMDSVRSQIRIREFETALEVQSNRMVDSVRYNNYWLLKAYNDSVVSAVNDSIHLILQTLTKYADYIDTSHVGIVNMAGETTDIRLQNDNERYERLWLKNEQNDSLRILVKNLDKKRIEMLIDDSGVTISRFRTKDTKEFDFDTLEREVNDFNKVGKSYEILTPWRIGGNGNLGFSQTYLKDWKKGGKSSIALLMVLNGFANYARPDGKVKWENSTEIRNGWIYYGGDDRGNEGEMQKNADRFEFTSRFGLSAFKKWYYSTELNFETQLFRGYRYPRSSNPDPISTILSPAKTFYKLGMEYKPNKNFSMMLSPLTVRNVFVRDTALIDQTKFGVDADRRASWVPGLNADIKMKYQITEDISYNTKYKMFINYQDPFKKFDVNWENNFQMKVSDYISLKLLLHFIYDDNILFKTDELDELGNPIYEPRLQVKQFFSIGFVYKINHQVLKAKRIR